MAALSIEEKGKGKRIITQFFRTMPNVQKSLANIFEREGYEGISHLQNLLSPKKPTEITSIETLRRGLSMILQHIYGMPVEDKEGYFQEVLKCKTAKQVIRKEKELLINQFYSNLPKLREYLKTVLVEDKDYQLMKAVCQRFIGEEEDVSDMRGFKVQVRNLHEALTEQVSSGTSEDSLIAIIKEQQEELEKEPALQAAEKGGAAEELATVSTDEAEEKKRIITTTLSDSKYRALRNVLMSKVTIDPNFSTFQQYLDNLFAPSSRLITRDMETFSQGIQKIKEFRDNLEKELSA